MGLDPSLQSHIHFGYYDDGHMLYLHTAALAKLHADLDSFYSEATSH